MYQTTRDLRKNDRRYYYVDILFMQGKMYCFYLFCVFLLMQHHSCSSVVCARSIGLLFAAAIDRHRHRRHFAAHVARNL